MGKNVAFYLSDEQLSLLGGRKAKDIFLKGLENKPQAKEQVTGSLNTPTKILYECGCRKIGHAALCEKHWSE